MATVYKQKRSNNWYYSISFQGRHYQGSTKTTNRQSAQQIANSIETDLSRQSHNLPTINRSIAKFTILFDEYLANMNVSKETKQLRIVASKHFLPVFNNRDINDISITDIEKYQLQRKLDVLNLPKNKNKKESAISFRFINIEIATLHNFFNFCIKQKIIQKNPASGIKKLNELSRIKTLSDEDILKLINGSSNKLTKDIITFLIYTGCRKGEALNLKWDDVDLKNGVIAIKATKTKFDRYIPISKPLKSLLSGIEKNPDCLYVFQRNGQKLTDFKRSFHTACKNAGFKDLHIHDLRHVFASKMVSGGTSLFITGELLGHRTTQMTKRYSHLVPETLQKAVDDVFK
jgi:integrase